MILDIEGQVANKIKQKSAYDTAQQMQKAAIMQMLIELLPLQTNLDGSIKPPPPIDPKQCMMLAEKCIDAFLRLVYKPDLKPILTLPQTLNKGTEETPNGQDKVQE